MITVSIPVYNQRVYPLVNQLYEQIKECGVPVDICIIDDASNQETRQLNRNECQEMARIIELEHNVGRAKIRNLFFKHVDSAYLLFLDNDVEIPSPKFIDNYINAIGTEKYAVVVGGHQYQKQKPARKYRLRWKYGNKREQSEATERNMNPYKSFMTSNFLVSRNVFDEVRFNESMTGYGHEDTLFGFELRKHKIDVYHINNPAQKKSLDSNAAFLRKTVEGLYSLQKILKLTQNNPSLIKDIKLLRIYGILEQKGFMPVLYFFFRIFHGIISRLLTKGWLVSLLLFDFYKLGSFYAIMRRKKIS